MPSPARALKSVRMLDHLIDFFGDGENWTTGIFHDCDGARCLVGAMKHIRAVHHLAGDPTRDYLLAAMPAAYQAEGLIWFNDHCKEYLGLLVVLARAREMALCDVYGLPAPMPAPETRRDGAEKRRKAMDARWQLILEVERERKAIGTPTYILCPRAPEREAMAA